MRTTSSPSAPPYSAAGGSKKRTSGSRGIAASGTYGGLEATTETVPSSSGKARSRSMKASSAFSAPTARSSLRPRERLHRVLGGEHPGVRDLCRHRERDRAAAGSEVDADRRGGCRGRQSVDRELRDDLGLGPGDEDARAHAQFEMPERRGARQVLQRLTGRATRDQSRRTAPRPRGRVHRRGSPRPARSPAGAEDVRGEELGIHHGVGDADARQAVDGARGGQRKAEARRGDRQT